jgi:hypothetical protein
MNTIIIFNDPTVCCLYLSLFNWPYHNRLNLFYFGIVNKTAANTHSLKLSKNLREGEGVLVCKRNII